MSNRKARRAWSAALRKHCRPGRVLHVELRHDPACLIYSNARVCTCNPDRVLMDDDRKPLATVEGVGPYDPLELSGVA
ncbi:hypothetical protein [Thiosulfatihalobacter marinus]|jgi:hypothetical protein|uniref:hypothetical protein n=1 Tax=Thiosulfatihalobacter marinus TaxID=2792481 RepID=UPI0018D85DDD|nr:hypothetical protein [Thiosulfatihalobacter marinus]